MTANGFRRIDYPKGGHGYTLNGRKILGATTLINKGYPKPALQKWQGEVTARFAVSELDTWTRMAPDAAVDYLSKEATRQTNRAAVRGTQIHELGARLAAGETVDVDEASTGVVDSYVQFLDTWQPDVLAIEFSVLNRKWWYAGTGDLLARIKGLGLCLLDIKTGRSGIWPEVALQLAAYRHAEEMLIDGHLQPMPKVDLCAAIWLQDDRYELVPVKAGEEEFATFLHVAFVAAFAGRDRDDVVLPPLEVGR